MPHRILRESILTSDPVDKLSMPAEVFYRRLMSVVDDFGRFDARPSILRAACFPLRIDKVREADISRWLTECETAGLIALYAVDEKTYVLYHKVATPRALTSKYPNPPETCAQVRASESRCAQVRPYSYSNSGSYANPPAPRKRGRKNAGERAAPTKADPDTLAALAACGITEPSLSRCAVVPGVTPVVALLLCEEAKRRATSNAPGWLVSYLTRNGFHPPKVIPTEDVYRLAKDGRIGAVAGHELHPTEPNVGHGSGFVEFTDVGGTKRRVRAEQLTPDAITVTVTQGRLQPCN
jgi:hypothetical protein